jgi:23S rRNA (cytidine1920-2'-O)/16S rRNA (cytidine1409-2'-O)-methyltransferase
MAGHRLDVEIAERGLTSSREQARAAVLEGRVTVDGIVVTKAGFPVRAESVIQVAEGSPFVSRGGVKLCGALDAFGIDPSGVQAIDVGASTGGFTDCLLQRGAEAVTAVDVGYGQLAWKLRTDDRVRVLERTNIRTADSEMLGGPYDLAVVDVSFVGLAKVLPAIMPLVGQAGQIVALVKPQFEAGKGRVGKKGVVRDPEIHRDVLEAVVREATAHAWVVRGLTWSPITGPEGNIEFWVWLARSGEPGGETPSAVVEAAHQALGG